ncbi:hypothetical protein UlMin_007989 [Ulmus minor]
MATQSNPAPPPPVDDNPQNPGIAQPAVENKQDVQAEAPKPNSSPSVFVNSEPMREDQIQNAVKFLSHPKVRGSPVMYRRSFLEKKGLTKEEIDEAFRRVPDPQPSTQTGGTNQDGQVKPSANIQQQTPTQALQPAAAAPSAVATLVRSRFHWSHAVIAVGLLAASGAGTAVLIKKAILPRFKSWIRKVVLEEENDLIKKIDPTPSVAEEAAAAAKAAAAAAADVARASQEMLSSKNEERRYFGELMNMLDMQVKEMKIMGNSIRKLEGETNALARNSLAEQDYQTNLTSSRVSSIQKPYTNGRTEYDSHSVRSASPPAPAEPSVAPHPKSYMDIMAMVQRGEKPPNIRDIDDSPPNPNQPPSNPHLAPRSKPWEVGQAQNNSGQVFQSQGSGQGLNSAVQDNGLGYPSNGDGSVPWWQRKNVRISEVANEDEFKAGSYAAPTNELPIKRSWVPPQPPPVAMAEAAEAIRRPKPLVQKEPSTEDQTVAPPSDVTDELQRVTKIAESGGAVEVNGGSYSLSSSEIQEAKDDSFETPATV